MDLLQLREKEIFETLKTIIKYNFVVIGGYAVNAYTLARFSVGCDIVVLSISEATKIENTLEKFGFKREKTKNTLPYHGEFERYEKIIRENYRVSIDVLIDKVYDRQTNYHFSAKWIFDNAKTRILKGKTISEEIKLRIVNVDALIVLKMISCRGTDIRDVFMLLPKADNKVWIKSEISLRHDFKNRFNKLKGEIISAKFKHNLHGVYGYIDNNVFERHKKCLLDWGK